MRRMWLLLAVLAWAPSPLGAQTSAPDPALAAEIRTLEDLATRAQDASVFARLSQAYATAGRAVEALRAIEMALAIRPNDLGFLRARATLATWTGDYRTAAESYRRLAAADPSDAEIALLHARVSAWAGDTDEAVREYRRYLQTRPQDAGAWLELSKAERWRGNYRAALDALDAYRLRFGPDAALATETAAVLTGAGRPRAAERVLVPLLSNTPDRVDLLLTQALALAEQRRARDAFASLDAVRAASPQAAETETAERVLRTLLASSAETPFTVYSDSDALRTARFSPRATVALRAGTTFTAGFDRGQLEARRGSGLEGVDGSTMAWYDQTFASVAQQFGRATVSGQTGYARDELHTQHTYAVGVDAAIVDGLRLSITRTFDPFVVSPRTVSLGITATTDRVAFDWAPTVSSHIAFDAAYDELSDGNRRWSVTISPRVAAARTSHVNLDVGFSAYRLETALDLANGYYDPRRYESYAGTVYPYLKLRENIGIALSVAAGVQRGSDTAAFRFGGSASAETTFGIYQPWALRISSTATLNQRLSSGAFRGFGGAAALVRRF